MKETKTDITFILDRSVLSEAIRNTTFKGFTHFLEDQQEGIPKARMSPLKPMIVFDKNCIVYWEKCYREKNNVYSVFNIKTFLGQNKKIR